jgi:ABC-type uncharacterized transport system involved in gliding motility auxiliary subunit
MNIKLLTGGGLALALILLLAVNIVSQGAFRSARLDLTEHHLYTLSEGTTNILANLAEPVTLRLFISQKLATRLPGISGYATRVEELLKEFKRAADNKLRLSIIEPEPFSEKEDRAVGYGLQGIPLSDGESTFFLGLVATGPTDEEEVIAFLSPEREEFLEYDIAKLIYQVAYPKSKVVGLLSSLPLDGVQSMPGLSQNLPRPWIVLEQIQQLFEVKKLESDIDVIPEDVDVLMLVHPKELSNKTLYAIDQFVLAGGRALIFVDPYSEFEHGTPPGAGTGPSDIGKLLETWGITFDNSKVVGDLQSAERVQFNRGSRAVVVDYPVWIKLPPALLDGKDIVTAELGSITLATPGSLVPTEDSGTTVETLMKTSPAAMEIDAMRLGITTDPQELLRQYRPANKSFILAARITGKISTAFPEGLPTEISTEDNAEDNSEGKGAKDGEKKTTQASTTKEAKPHLTESSDAVNLIVVADTDLLQDRFWVQVQNLLGNRIAMPTAANGTFVVNALDNLTGSNDLISVRNRGHFTRPFTRVDEIRQQTELRFREKEQELMDRLQETEHRLVELERGKTDESTPMLSTAQLQEIERFRQQKIQLRKELRQVRHELHKNIENLESWAKFINIGLMPMLVAIGGIGVAVYRQRRRKLAAAKRTVQSQ